MALSIDKFEGGFHRSISVNQRSGIPRTRSEYAMVAPGFTTMGSGVRIRKRIHGGVICSRFSAREKKSKTTGKGCGTHNSRWSV
jgi:hypothetical protein